MKLSRMLFAGAAGATLAYFFDPDSGRRRRAMARDRLSAAARRGRRSGADRAEYLAGQVAAAPAAVSVAKPARGHDDATLADRVMTELFGDTELKSRVNVSAQNGVVVLVGEVDDPDEVVKRAKKVKGVNSVESLLHRPGTPAPHMA